MTGIPFFQDAVFLATQIRSEPNRFVRPIAEVFAFVIDFLFNLVYSIGPRHSLGFAIILMTIVFRVALLPLGIKSQRSMMKMQQLNPEVDKIRKKYGDTKDREKLQKMNQEIQALYAKHDVNPLKGCLPMLIQMPLFFGLNFIMHQAFLYITRLRELYFDLSTSIQHITPHLPGGYNFLRELARPYIPDAWQNNALALQNLVDGGMRIEDALDQVGDVIVLSIPEHLSRVINRFTMDDWDRLFYYIPNHYLPHIQDLFYHRQDIVTFFGLPLVENAGWAFPGILIPILAIITTFISSWLGQQVSKPKDDKMKTQQTIMLVIMPFFMGFITIGLPGGVGLFWITSSLIQMVQQIIMNAQAGVKLKLPFSSGKQE